MRKQSSIKGARALAAFAVAAALGAAGEFAGPPLASATPAPGSMSGTVASVDGAAREVDLVTGVGQALRRVVFHVGPDCRILVAGAEAGLRDVKRGAVVEVRYRIALDRYEALVIETRAVGTRPRGEP